MPGLSATDSELLAPLFTTEAMRAVFSDEARLQGMLDFEAALARVQARLGVIPAQAALAIEAKCRADLYDLAALGEATADAGVPTIPLVKALTAKVARPHAGYVHWGATSQDMFDTGFVLQTRHAFALIERDLDRLGAALADLTDRHRATLMAGRTWLQHAAPTTFGAKLAASLDALCRHRDRLGEARARGLVLSLSGAAGTLASLGDQARPVARALACELDLDLPATPWHTARDRAAEAGAVLGMMAGTAGKLALDMALLMQTEIGEVAEGTGAGKGGSSTMPQKRNPAISVVVIAAARQAHVLVPALFQSMLAEHERPIGAWHAEWSALPQLFALTSGALAGAARLLEGLEVDADRMRANLDATGGQIMAEALMMALGPRLGRDEAHARVAALCRTAGVSGRHLADVAAEDAEIAAAVDLGRVLDPANYLGIAELQVDRALSAWRREKTQGQP